MMKRICVLEMEVEPGTVVAVWAPSRASVAAVAIAVEVAVEAAEVLV